MWKHGCGGHRARHKQSCQRARPSARATCSEKRSAAAAWASFARPPQRSAPVRSRASGRPPQWLINTVAIAAVLAAVCGFRLGFRIGERLYAMNQTISAGIQDAVQYVSQPVVEAERYLAVDVEAVRRLGAPVQVHSCEQIEPVPSQSDEFEFVLAVGGPLGSGTARCLVSFADSPPRLERIELSTPNEPDYTVFTR